MLNNNNNNNIKLMKKYIINLKLKDLTKRIDLNYII